MGKMNPHPDVPLMTCRRSRGSGRPSTTTQRGTRAVRDRPLLIEPGKALQQESSVATSRYACLARRLEQRSQRQLNPKRLSYSRSKPRRQQRMATKFKEVVVAPHTIELEH